MSYTLPIQEITPLACNVHSYKLPRPDGFTFTPGQACDVAIAENGWKHEKRPFTFTSLPHQDYLEFMIKSYHDHDGVTDQLPKLSSGDALTISDPWGTIEHKGKGTFIAGGAGITPFVAILRDLQRNGNMAGHQLFFANKAREDIFPTDLLDDMDGLAVTHVLSKEQTSEHAHGRIDKDFLIAHIQDFSQHFYVCGPDAMVEDINSVLKDLGADPNGLVFEE